MMYRMSCILASERDEQLQFVFRSALWFEHTPCRQIGLAQDILRSKFTYIKAAIMSLTRKLNSIKSMAFEFKTLGHPSRCLDIN